ncbi:MULTISPECIES: hypothetical protein [Cysteiniphilum]|uniref:hypothetical protein n=1 Tax=Cysteiniphilum TaxID=2056696 RepID=UPI0017843896|nr:MULTISPECIES: hypothetical protein [Cysteiniphilum]
MDKPKHTDPMHGILSGQHTYSFSVDHNGKSVLELSNLIIKANELQLAVGDSHLKVSKKSFSLNVSDRNHILLNDHGIEIKAGDTLTIYTDKNT